MFEPGKDQRQFVDNLQRVVGTVQELTAVSHHSGWRLAALHRGREVRVTLLGKHYRLSGATFAVRLAVPARLYIEGHYASYSQTPVVRTGDPEFDRPYKVHGFPPEVIQGVLDARTRRWFLDTYGEKTPQTLTEDGWLHVTRTYRRTRDTYELAPELIPTPDEICHFLDKAIELADRIAAGFHSTYEAIARAQGPEAAARWASTQEGVLASGEAAQRKLRIVVFAVLGIVIVLPVLVVLAAAVGFALLAAVQSP
jgi:hypothetical protein